MLGEVVRSRRALAAETADRLRLASEEREAEAGAAGSRGTAAHRPRTARRRSAHSHGHHQRCRPGSACTPGTADQPGGPGASRAARSPPSREDLATAALTEMQDHRSGHPAHRRPPRRRRNALRAGRARPAARRCCARGRRPPALQVDAEPSPASRGRCPPRPTTAAYRILQEVADQRAARTRRRGPARRSDADATSPARLAHPDPRRRRRPPASPRLASRLSAATGLTGHGIERAEAVERSFSAAAGPDGGFEASGSAPRWPDFEVQRRGAPGPGDPGR